jgi:signal transduction histidine kinase
MSAPSNSSTSSPPADSRLLEVSQLAGGLAHEIRNPLSTLLLNLKLLEEDLGAAIEPESDFLRRARRRIGLARDEADRLQRMLDEFLLLVGPVRLRRTPVDLNTIVTRLAEFYGPEAERHGAVLRAEPAPAPLIVEADASYLQQALLNLLINAREAIAGQGAITVHLRADGDMAVLEVADTGDGMTSEVAAKAMQAFYSTKPSGSGLGLSTTSRIVAAHGGTLTFTSQPGAGTCFEIRLPRSEK